MKRRDFLELSATAGALGFLNAHALFASTGCTHKTIKKKPITLIRTLRLQTTTALKDLSDFYGNELGWKVTEKPGEIWIDAGESTIQFVPADNPAQRPFYHVAFNIPENQIQQAFEWQRKKTSVIHPNPSGPRNQVVHFNHWNAHSIFFLDPAGNLLEYIARHDLDNASTADFGPKEIQCVSEIGFIVDDVQTSGEALSDSLALPSYRDVESGFWPIGDESGLLLMIRKGRIWTAHPGQENKTDVFKTEVTISSNQSKIFEFPGFPYTVKAGTA